MRKYVGKNEFILKRLREMKRCFPDKLILKTSKNCFDYPSLDKFANRIAARIEKEFDDTRKLKKSEQIRYSRQMLMDRWGIESQERLKGTSVFVAGAGGSGSPLIIQLALLGVGNIIVCDYDSVELSNLNRQCLHNESTIGVNKAVSAKMSIEKLNPNVNVEACTEKITRENVCRLVGKASIIFDNVDDIETKFILSECAVHKQIPHTISSMLELSSYAALFHSPETPCLHCIYDINILDDINAMKSYSKNYKKNTIPVASPSLFLSTGFICNEALKILLGIGTVAYNKYFLFNQKASDNFADTDGFKMITYPFNAFFKKLCKEQGFDWDGGWNGNFVEELFISKNPGCTVCGEKRESLSIVPGADKGTTAPGRDHGLKKERKRHNRVIAVLLDDCGDRAASLIAVFKTGKTFLALEPKYSEEDLAYILQDSEARLIITDNGYYPLAERIRNRVNKNIKIINMSSLIEHASPPISLEARECSGEDTAYILYEAGPGGKLKGFKHSHHSMARSVADLSDYLHINQTDRIFLLKPSGTVFNWQHQILCALMNGALLTDEPPENTEMMHAMEQYWLNRIENLVYTDLPHKSNQEKNPEEILRKKAVLDMEFTDRIDGYCRQSGISRIVFLLGIYKLTIFKEINQEDLSIEVPVPGCRDTGNLPAMLTNKLVIRSVIHTGAMLKCYLRQLKDVMTEALANRDYPYEELCSRMLKTSGEMRLLPMSFIYLVGEDGCTPVINDIEEPGIPAYAGSNPDIGLYVQQDGKEVFLNLLYKEELYEDYVLERFFGNFMKIALMVLEKTEGRIYDIDLNKDASMGMLDLDNEFENEDMF